MTKKEYEELAMQLESAWIKYENIFKDTAEKEKAYKAWRDVIDIIEDYRKTNCDFPDWQDKNF